MHDSIGIIKKLEEISTQIDMTINGMLVSSAQQSVQDCSNFTMYFTIFVLACFVGYYVIWKVTPSLHAPLMSITNAISSVIIVGAIIAAGQSFFISSSIFGFFGVFFAAINIFGGFMITYRMLDMFKGKNKR